MTDPEAPDEEPKIIIDDDWKEQVAKEKAAAVAGQASDDDAEPAASEPVDSSSQVTDDSAAEETDDSAAEENIAPPPASFEVLVTMLFTQAMATLGQLPNPATGKSEVNKPYAKHYIDTLEMLGEKTKGNLTEEESSVLSDALHAMRMAYVNAKA